MDFRTFYNGLDDFERSAFADNAGRSRRYIETHLLHRRKMPTVQTMQNLASASSGACTYADVLDFFYGPNLAAKQ